MNASDFLNWMDYIIPWFAVSLFVMLCYTLIDLFESNTNDLGLSFYLFFILIAPLALPIALADKVGPQDKLLPSLTFVLGIVWTIFFLFIYIPAQKGNMLLAEYQYGCESTFKYTTNQYHTDNKQFDIYDLEDKLIKLKSEL